VAHNLVRRVPLKPAEDGTARYLSPAANEFSGLFGIGHENRRGWNAAFRSTYNFRDGVMLYSTAQVSYNTDCCGFSVQYRRLGFATRNENQFYFSFAIANIGSFGTLKKQDRLF
jgi:LPS-assembly protein